MPINIEQLRQAAKELQRRQNSDSCQGKPDDHQEFVPNRADPSWTPRDTHRYIEIMVTGDPHQAKGLARAVDDIQKTLSEDPANHGRLKFRVRAFLDGCQRKTEWGSSPQALDTTFHCHRSNTDFETAFHQCLTGDRIPDSIIIVGHRFDDNLERTLANARKLATAGTKIFALCLGNEKVATQYRSLTHETQGQTLLLKHLKYPKELTELMTAIAAHTLQDRATLDTLLESARLPETRQLAQFLRGDQAQP